MTYQNGEAERALGELATLLRDLATALREDWDDNLSDVSSIAGRIRLLIHDAIGSSSVEREAFVDGEWVPITADRAPEGTLRRVTASVPTLQMESDDPADRDMLRAHRLAMHVGALAVDSRAIDRVKAAEQAETLVDRLAPVQVEPKPHREPRVLPDLHRAIMDLLGHTDRRLTREQIAGCPGPNKRLTREESQTQAPIKSICTTVRPISNAVDDLIEWGLVEEACGKGKGVALIVDPSPPVSDG